MGICKCKMGWQLPGSSRKAVIPGYLRSCTVDMESWERRLNDFYGYKHRAGGRIESYKLKSKAYQQVTSEILFCLSFMVAFCISDLNIKFKIIPDVQETELPLCASQGAQCTSKIDWNDHKCSIENHVLYCSIEEHEVNSRL